MQITEILNEGLRREIKAIVPATDMEGRLIDRIVGVKDQIKLNGFRPGKVPIAHLRKVYGRSFMAEIIGEILSDVPHSILSRRGELSVTQPKVSIHDDEKEIEKILSGKADFIFTLHYEVFPTIEIEDFSSIEITNEVIEISDKEIDEQVEHALSSVRTYTIKNDQAEKADRVTIKYVSQVDGKKFKDSGGDYIQLVLGSKMFIPGLEEQLIGSRAGNKKILKVILPMKYNLPYLASKEAIFDIMVKEVASPDKLEISDETAKKLGFESLAHLRCTVREKIENQYGLIARQKIKDQIFDALIKNYQFEVPEQLIEIELNTIRNQVNPEPQTSNTFENEDKRRLESQSEYHKRADQRVRLNLILSRIGEKAGITVSNDELKHAIHMKAIQWTGKEQTLFDFLNGTPEVIVNLRRLIFEEKIVDYLQERVRIIDKKIVS